MKILVIYTGGTIGSSVSGEYVAVDEAKKHQLLEQIVNSREDFKNVFFDTVNPYYILSENVTAATINCLASCIRENMSRDYKGIIVVHGTDTVQYMAAAMDYMFADTKIPILFASSNYVLEDERANGVTNFEAAADFILDQGRPGCYIAYQNHDKKVYIHRSTRVLPHLPLSDEIYSIFDQYLGYYENGVYQENKAYKKGESTEEGLGVKMLSEDRSVQRIFSYPGMQLPSVFSDAKAVLMNTYHSGTLCNKTPHFEKFMKQLNRAGIPVFVVGATGETQYESVKALDTDLHFLPPASPVAMYVKLWLLINKEGNLTEMMQIPMCEDLF